MCRQTQAGDSVTGSGTTGHPGSWAAGPRSLRLSQILRMPSTQVEKGDKHQPKVRWKQ